MIKRLLILLLMVLISACSKEEPIISTKEDNSVDAVADPELIAEHESDEIVDKFIEFPLPDEQVIINLKMVPILSEYLHAVQDQQQFIKNMRLIPINTEDNGMYLLEFSCANELCSYILLNQNQDGPAYLVADLAKYIHTIISPDKDIILLQFNRETALPSPLTNIVAIDTIEWNLLSLHNEDYQHGILNYKWHFTSVNWVDNETISLSIPGFTNDPTSTSVELDAETTNIIMHINK